MQLKFELIFEFLGDFNFRTCDWAVFALKVQKFLDKINFKPVEQYQAGLEKVSQIHPPVIFSDWSLDVINYATFKVFQGCKNLGALWLSFLRGNGLHNFLGNWGISPRTKC